MHSAGIKDPYAFGLGKRGAIPKKFYQDWLKQEELRPSKRVLFVKRDPYAFGLGK